MAIYYNKMFQIFTLARVRGPVSVWARVGSGVRLGLCACALMITPLVGACSLYEESFVTPHRVEVHRGAHVENFVTTQVDEAVITHMGQAFRRYGDGSLHITVTYDPHGSHNTALMAKNSLTHIAGEFRRIGIHALKTEIMPVPRQGAVSQTLISFESLRAQAPAECTPMPAMGSGGANYQGDYALGCGLETAIAAQIYRPADLLGRENLGGHSDGRRAGNILEPYRAGIKNPTLRGEKASDN